MTELKTLKDLAKENDDELSFGGYTLDILKAEAVKDIKAIINMKKTFHDLMYEKLTGNKLEYSEEGKQAIINYIKWKFNLTEEDLEEKEE